MESPCCSMTLAESDLSLMYCINCNKEYVIQHGELVDVDDAFGIDEIGRLEHKINKVQKIKQHLFQAVCKASANNNMTLTSELTKMMNKSSDIQHNIEIEVLEILSAESAPPVKESGVESERAEHA